jgi:hypothetical protein
MKSLKASKRCGGHTKGKIGTTSSLARPPAPGDIIEFCFLWKHEHDAGLIEGVKDRRCVVVAVLAGGKRVLVAPITSREPEHEHKISVPGAALGLDRQSWIVTSELNVTAWPGHDLRPARTPKGAWWRYGRLSDALRNELADQVGAQIKKRRAKVVSRD